MALGDSNRSSLYVCLFELKERQTLVSTMCSSTDLHAQYNSNKFVDPCFNGHEATIKLQSIFNEMQVPHVAK